MTRGAGVRTLTVMSVSASRSFQERPTGWTPGLRRLTRMLDALVARESSPSVVAHRTGLLLRQALDDAALLEPRHCVGADDHYRQHVVHVHPSGAYSVVALV